MCKKSVRMEIFSCVFLATIGTGIRIWLPSKGSVFCVTMRGATAKVTSHQALTH